MVVNWLGNLQIWWHPGPRRAKSSLINNIKYEVLPRFDLLISVNILVYFYVNVFNTSNKYNKIGNMPRIKLFKPFLKFFIMYSSLFFPSDKQKYGYFSLKTLLDILLLPTYFWRRSSEKWLLSIFFPSASSFLNYRVSLKYLTLCDPLPRGNFSSFPRNYSVSKKYTIYYVTPDKKGNFVSNPSWKLQGVSKLFYIMWPLTR